MSRTILIIGGTWQEREEKAKSFFPKPTPHPDYLIVFPEISIGINQVREIQHFVGLRPYSQPQKVAFVKEAQNLTIEAQNAFLKTLEEPPERTLIILGAPAAENLLPTIVSRCQIIKLKNKPSEETKRDYQKIYQEFLSFLSKSVGEAFAYIAASLSNREKALKWLEENQALLYTAFHQSQREKSKAFILTNTKYSSLQRALERAKREIERNVSPRFVLENFFLKNRENFALKY